MIFKASFDKAAVTITVVITVLFSAIIVMQMLFIFDSSPLLAWFVTIFLVATYLLAFAFHPVKYSITEKELVVHRPVSDKRINKTIIKSATVIKKENISAARVFGSGGFFGYYGSFVNYSLGKMRWYVTRRDRAVLVQTAAGEKLLLSPDQPELFIQSLTGLS